MTLNDRNVTLAEIKQFYGAHHKNFNEDRSILLAAKCRSMILVSRNIRYMLIFAGVLGEGRQIQYMLPYTRVQTASAVSRLAINRYYVLWTCDPVVVTCETVSHGQRSRNRDSSILSVSSLISIIVSFTVVCRDFRLSPWFSVTVLIMSVGPTLCNFSIWTVADVGLYKKAVLW